MESPVRPSMRSPALGMGSALRSKMSTTRDALATASRAESGWNAMGRVSLDVPW